MEGFLVFDYEHRSQEAIDRLASGYWRASCATARDSRRTGSGTCAIAGLYRGENLGKRVIRVDH
jgi:NADPH-dependent curcumin reductase CurA